MLTFVVTLLCQILEDVVKFPRVFRGDCPQSLIAVHPAGAGSDLETVEPSVHILVLEVLPVQAQGVISVGHRVPEETRVYEAHQDDVTPRGQPLLEKVESGQGVVVEQLLRCHLGRVLTAGAHVIPSQIKQFYVAGMDRYK